MVTELHETAVSVIVPVYKVENYIERCAISLFEQTLDDIEFIFVDDKSPDRSVEILHNVLNKYPAQKEKVTIVHHSQNLGSAMVRETGFKHAKGRYIIHCDSDDWVDKEMYDIMYKTAINENADIVVCDYVAEYVKKSIIFTQKCELKKDKFIFQLLSGQLHSSLWNKLISRDLYSQISFLWRKDCNMWEDFLIVPRLAFYVTNKICYIPKAFYHYSQYNINSYTKNPSLSSVKSILEVSSIINNFFEKQGYPYELALMFFKLSVKCEVLSTMAHYHREGDYRQLYAEADHLIFKHPSLPLYRKILLWLWVHSMDSLASAILKMISKLRDIIRNRGYMHVSAQFRARN